MVTYINGTSAFKSDKVIAFPTAVEKKERKPGNYKVGEKQEVYPFRKTEDIQKMCDYFMSEDYGNKEKRYRDYTLFKVGINVGLRAGDLLKLKWSKVLIDGEITSEVEIKEEKTDKFRKFFLNDSAKIALKNYYDVIVEEYHNKIDTLTEKMNGSVPGGKMFKKYEEAILKEMAELENLNDSYIFSSKKGDYIDVKAAGLILKKAAKDIGIKFNVGTHSMRKTFGYWQIKLHNNDATFICHLQEMFNHSSPLITLRYCGIEAEVMHGYYDDLNL